MRYDPNEVSPDEVLVDRLIHMRDGFSKTDPTEFLARQVAFGEMTAEKAERLRAMVAEKSLTASVRLALTQLDGTAESAVSLLSGLSTAELEDLGGFGPLHQPRRP